jgi:Fe2+ or Zn2+ uptake regulation protein
MRPFAHVVLAELRASRTPQSAYDLARLISIANGKTYAPNTIYRSLRDLVAAGLVKHIASLKAFVPLSLHNGCHPAFLVCDHCGVVEEAEMPEIVTSLTALGCSVGRVRLMRIARMCVCGTAISSPVQVRALFRCGSTLKF